VKGVAPAWTRAALKARTLGRKVCGRAALLAFIIPLDEARAAAGRLAAFDEEEDDTA
jgi:hypothetical protein